jgi:hypothetical protein
MRVVLGARVASEDQETQKQVALHLARSRPQDYWLMVYDAVGAKICDVIVQAKVAHIDDDGRLLRPGEILGSPAGHVFAITSTLPEDSARLANAFLSENPPQIAWKQLPDGTFYVPKEWPSHTNGRPHTGPLLTARWERGEHPSTISRMSRAAPHVLDMWLMAVGIASLLLWIRGC